MSRIRTSFRKSPKFIAAVAASASAALAASAATAAIASAGPAGGVAGPAQAAHATRIAIPAGPASASVALGNGRLTVRTQSPRNVPGLLSLDAAAITQRRVARNTAQKMLGHFGWGARQWTPLDKLWTRESGWNKWATNPYSGAYGIPQAVPGSKMASAGRDWRSNATTQIRWGMRYIRSVYGYPRRAWEHELAHGWY